MKAYKALRHPTQQEFYFKKISTMCKHFGWDEQNIRNRKHKSGLPLVKKDNNSFYIISEIEVI